MSSRELFNFMLERVKQVGAERSLPLPQAFARWFVELYFSSPQEVLASDGAWDGKVDLTCTVLDGNTRQRLLLNSKFTESFAKRAPPQFYEEILAFENAVKNAENRTSYLASIVREDVRRHYRAAFKEYDQGNAKLVFVTNCAENENQRVSVRFTNVEVFHLDDLLQFMADHIEDAMPRTNDLVLTGISTLVSTTPEVSEVPTSIVFARLADFISYMDDDPHELLFARNVRLTLGKTPVNKEIARTFVSAPTEFAYSNNGITVLCEKVTHDPGKGHLTIVNPRVVNGSQTLHSIRDAEQRPANARVLTRLIEVPPVNAALPAAIAHRKEIINKISVRSNRQNEIKKWDLVCNDDFQHQLARYFRSRGYFYERRRQEWKARRTELKSVGIERGPDLRGLTQLLACFYWRSSGLGPVAARAPGELFEDAPYETIRSTEPAMAYQIWWAARYMDRALSSIGAKRKYVSNLSSYMRFTLLSLIVRASERVKAQWGSSMLTQALEAESDEIHKKWRRLVEQCIRQVREEFRAADRQTRRHTREPLSPANFFKAQRYVEPILNAPLSRPIVAAAKNVFAT